MNNHDVRRYLSIGMVAVAIGCGAAIARAFDFQNSSGSLTGSWDTTVTFGNAWRIETPDCRLIATANGGCGRSPNIDDGNLNYASTDLYSQAFKAVTELSLNYREVGAFVRASAFYDLDTHRGKAGPERTPLPEATKDLVSSYTRLLDAFVYSRFRLGGKAAELRLGRQAVSWGESTFIQGGLSVINHFDVAALRVPGSELKEGFLPQEMVNFSIQLTDNFSVQGIYLLDWNPTIPEPAGSYFSSNDIATPGGTRAILGFGAFSDRGVDFRPLGGPFIGDFQNISRLPDRRPRDKGQGGIAFKWYAPNINNGTDVGLYFMTYNSRLPVISGRTGTAAGIANAWGTVNAAQAAALALASGQSLSAAIATGVGVGRAASRNNALGFVGNIADATLAQYATIAANTVLARGNVTAQATNLAVHEYAKTGGYFVEYPEDIKMIGVSFNTQIQRGGVALQGELTYRQDVPLQYDDVELLFAALTPFEAGLGLLQQPMLPTGTPLSAFTPPPCTLATNTLNACNQLGRFGINQDIQGWGRYDTFQAQVTATKTFANVLKAAQMVVVLETAVNYIADLPNKFGGGPNGRGLRFNGPGTSVSGNPEFAPRHFNEVEPANRFADSMSWGYRLAGRLEYPGLMGPWNVVPRFSWQHDVDGTSPGPGGNFVEGRYALTLGVSANLRARWELDTSWTKFGGAGRFNDINDRDFVGASIKYSF
ncbi:MAG: DUF1302 domain-containing protein [Steroidobacteraceae bacterium]|nr:DUF1302 domain-containing protein [Steroidobacteraceae bacterium]